MNQTVSVIAAASEPYRSQIIERLLVYSFDTVAVVAP